MLFVEFLALLTVGAGTIAGINILWSKFSKSRAWNEERTKKKFDDLYRALKSKDYHELDDWLVVYHDDISDELRDKVLERREELYIDKDSRHEDQTS